MFWILVVYPRAGVVVLLTLALFAAFALATPSHPVVGVVGCLVVAVGGLEVATRVARWEARRRGGTGDEGSGPIEPRGPGSWG